MQHQLNCNQVVTLLTFYIENKLDKSLSIAVREHLNNCRECSEKYEKLKRILENFSAMKSKIAEEECDNFKEYETEQYKRFKANLSAYIDNELSDNDNIKIKKIAISNPLARKDLEEVYAFKQLLQSSFNRTKNDLKDDHARRTLEKMFENTKEEKVHPFYKLVGIFACIMVFMIIGLINLLNF